MSNNTLLCAASICVAVSFALIWRRQHSRSRPPYPPGPSGYPLVGGALDVPRDVPIWKGFVSMAQKFNTDALYVKLFSTDFVVLNSSETICNLLEKRSIIYSDRPMIPMIELMDGYSWSIAAIGYGLRWRKGRRLFHEFFNTKAVTNFDDHQRKYAYRFLSRLAQTPDDFFDHAQFVTGALVMEITYGLNIKSHENKFLQAAQHAMKYVERTLVPGEFLVDTFPALKHVPGWFPGAGFKRFAKDAQRQFDVAVDGPLEYVKETLKSDGSNVSIASSCFDRVVELRNQGFDESDIRSVTATIFTAATDATMAILQAFFLAMALHPHVVRKAQDELDRVIGNERLPDFSDRENLPYISALLKELLRWICPVPLGVPKRAMEDDIYEGYLIPAGATILENIWAVCYNEVVFPAPQIYDPERFLRDGSLNGSINDPEVRVFGSGRRSCPGGPFALRALFLNIACTLAVFDISAPVGEQPEVKYHEGFVRHPFPFKCVIKPRSAASLRLARDAGEMADRP